MSTLYYVLKNLFRIKIAVLKPAKVKAFRQVEIMKIYKAISNSTI